jgi:hypothetical protein
VRHISTELDIVYSFLKDAKSYGLEPEVVLFALRYLQKNPNGSIEDAMSYGYWEWCK